MLSSLVRRWLTQASQALRADISTLGRATWQIKGDKFKNHFEMGKLLAPTGALEDSNSAQATTLQSKQLPGCSNGGDVAISLSFHFCLLAPHAPGGPAFQ